MAYFDDSYIKKICETNDAGDDEPYRGEYYLGWAAITRCLRNSTALLVLQPLDTSEAEDNETGNTRQYLIRD